MELSISLILKAVYLLLIANVLIKALKWLSGYVHKVRVINKIKGMPMLPLIGNVHQIKRKHEFLAQFCDLSRKYKDEPIWRLWIGWRTNIVFHRPDYVDILFNSAKNSQKSPDYDFLHPWLGSGLLTSYGDKWQVRRRMITPTFHFEILNDFLPVMNEQAEILVEILTKLSKEKQEIDIFSRLKSCALDVICETAMGQNLNAQNDKTSDYVQAVAKISELILIRMFEPYVWLDCIYSRTASGKEHRRCLNILHDFTKKVIQERDSEYEDLNISAQKRVAFLDILLKAKHDDPSITFDDIREEVDTFMFEGHDTTAAAASWACQLIGSHPEIQKKLHQEIDTVIGDSSRPLTNDDLRDLKYLDLVIKEVLRLYPSVPFFGRRISEDTKVGDYTIMKGDAAVIFAYMIHRDEKYYPDPEKFDPDRFLPENSRDRHPYAYIPFSAGRRNCIGQRFAIMEEKVLLANILRKFEIVPLKKTEELYPVADLIVHPLNGIPVKLKFRSF